MKETLRKRLEISPDRLDALNKILLNPDMQVVDDFLDVVVKYGTPEEINAKAAAARELPALRQKVEETHPEYLADLDWLMEQRDAGVFISVEEYRRKVLGDKAESMTFMDDFAVTLEVSAAQYFPWLITATKRAIKNRDLLPGRFIRVRKMKEQELDGDLPAFAAAMTNHRRHLRRNPGYQRHRWLQHPP